VDGLSGLFLPKQQMAMVGKSGEKILSNPALTSVSEEIRDAIQTLKDGQQGHKIVLVIDQLDLLLASGGDQIGAVGLGEMLMGLREVRDSYRPRSSIKTRKNN
jgi:elongator complex protein 6